ncbi:MAG TPA: ankyrin repeat domain-containing protein, partial [Candidatus Obscuribacterales bacterium]
SGQLKIFDQMLAAGVSPARKDAEGASALMYAARGGQTEIFERLLRSGAVTETTTGGETLLMAAAAGSHARIVEILLARKVDVNARDRQGRTALMLLCAYRDYDRLDAQLALIEALLKAGADPGLRDLSGRTVLHFATPELADDGTMFCQDQAPVAAKLLSLPLKFDLNAQDARGRTVLMHLVFTTDVKIVETLLERGANPNLQDHDGNYALLGLYTHQCHPDIHKYGPMAYRMTENAEFDRKVALLLAHGANPRLVNKAGQSAQALAGQNESPE